MQRISAVSVVGALLLLTALLLSACTSGVSQSDFNALQARLQAKESELAKLQQAIPTPTPPFGIGVEMFDASGPPAYEAQPGQLLAFVQSGMAYDSPAASNFLTVVDVRSRRVLVQVAVDMPRGYQTHGLAVSADARWIYLPSFVGSSRKLHILDGRSLKLAKTLDVGAYTHHADEGTYKQTDRFILVDTGNPEHGQIVLDPNNSNEVIGHIPFSTVVGRPYSGWSSPDGSFAYITASSHLSDQKGWISKIDLSTFKETAFVPVGVGPVWVAFAADGKTAWVSNAGSNDVMQVKIGQSRDEKDQVVATVPLGGSPYGIVLTHDGKKLYVAKKTYGAANSSTSVYVVDTEAKKVIKEIKVGKQPDHVFLTPDGREVWVGENRGYEISIIDTATDEVTGYVPMPGDVHSIRFIEVSTPSAGTAPVSTAAPTAPAAKAGTVPASSASPTGASADLIARGQKTFSQSSAKCQLCHGEDARGSVGPNIRGKTADDIRYQLENNPQMQSIKLSGDEIEAVGAYLQSLPK
ncbi:MAG: beta-propeller fold lactonase family protein [Chloroflexi bacterium]|nr:beta-propeller fold lactonase family protein [Chloroflexota bacterium]